MNISVGNYSKSEVQRRNYDAEKLFKSIKNVTNRAKALADFKRRYPNYKPEPFYGSTSYKKRKGYEALIGKSTNLSHNCGQIGRLRVIAGAPLHWTRISFKDLPSVSAFATDPDAQFSQQVIDWAIEDLSSIVSGPFVAVVERGWYGGNHIHVFHLEGACNVGYSRLIPDDKLPETAAYIYKKPYWNDENALAYLLSAYLNGKAPKRVFYRGLGNAKTRAITVGDVEQAMKLPLLKKALAVKKSLAQRRKKPNYQLFGNQLMNPNT